MDIFFSVKIFADWISYSVFGLTEKTIFAEAINFFIYDAIKIFILLSIIIFFVSIIRSFMPPEKIRDILLRKNKFLGHLLAGMFGIITPFCSCSAIPLFLGCVEAGVPLGITFSFLVASPMINEVALVMLLGMFGLKVALIYIISGLAIAIFSGMIIGRLKVETLMESFIFNSKIQNLKNNNKMSWKERGRYAQNYTCDIIKKIWLYILIAIGLGAWIHGYIPADFLARYASACKWYAVPLAVLIGIPLYSNAAGVIPIANALFKRGMALGAVLAFMMSVTALSLPQFLILRKAMKTKLILIFALIVGIGIIFTGYLFNWLLPILL